VPRAERIWIRVAARQGISPKAIHDAIREYTTARNPWTVRTRRPLVLSHASGRAEGVRFELKTDKSGVSLLIHGGNARLALAYAATLLANTRFADLIAAFTVELP
jgi:hypothetical protein